MSFVAVADTHAALWHLFDDPRLSPHAGSFIDAATAARHEIAVSATSLVEVAYLVEKGRVPPSAYDVLTIALADPDHVFVEIPLTSAVADSLRRIPREDIPDMPDRIIAATALHLSVPIVSRDGRIRSSTLETIW